MPKREKKIKCFLNPVTGKYVYVDETGHTIDKPRKAYILINLLYRGGLGIEAVADSRFKIKQIKNTLPDKDFLVVIKKNFL